MSSIIYLDESGDLGWSFERPYRAGGSSRHLTIASLEVSPNLKDKPKRLVKKLYRKFNWNTSKEKKWSEMSVSERTFFAEKALELTTTYPS
ncbi:DUF3800 domain-containing protein, partial [Providencia hangzhouensis]